MPSYPTSPKSFTTKNAGDSILAAHVNDIQDEVNAIEAGLLNATAPLNSSNSTMVALNVTGNSTFAASLLISGNLIVDGPSTFSSVVTFRARPVEPPPHAARVFLQSTYAMGSSAASTLSFLSDDYVTNSSMHSTATNPDRLIPQSTGLYFLTAQVLIASSNTNWSQVSIQDSSGTIMGALLTRNTIPGSYLQATAFKRFDALGGFLTCVIAQDGASTQSLSSGVGTYFSMTKL